LTGHAGLQTKPKKVSCRHGKVVTMSETTEAPVSPHSRTEQALAEIWRRTLELDWVGARDDFFQLGGDSIAAAQVLLAVQRKFGRSFPLAALFKAPTIEEMAALIERPAEPPPTPCLVVLQPSGTKPPFFCVHAVGGYALAFVQLARHFPPDQPFYAVRAPGPAGPEPPRVEEMACRYLAEARAVQPEGPYCFGGNSFGGSVALEMAQQARAAGQGVALLGILDHTPPPVRYCRVLWSPAVPLDFAVNAARWVAEDIWRAGPGRRLATLLRLARVAWHELLRALRRTAPASGREDAEAVFGLDRLPEEFRLTVEAHYQAMRDYAPKVYPGRVTLFRARVRPLFRLHGRDLGWGALAGGGLEVVAVPGNHDTMLKEPNVRVLAEALLARLRDCHGERRTQGSS
jgi:thioesterase domain-containing protein/acyl carrier protein